MCVCARAGVCACVRGCGCARTRARVSSPQPPIPCLPPGMQVPFIAVLSRSWKAYAPGDRQPKNLAKSTTLFTAKIYNKLY
jgi:hypothetical protein